MLAARARIEPQTIFALGPVVAEAVCRCVSRRRARATAPATACQAFVLDVLRESKGAADHPEPRPPELVRKLFEMEVPEIAEGVVVIEAVAREPGGRTKDRGPPRATAT